MSAYVPFKCPECKRSLGHYLKREVLRNVDGEWKVVTVCHYCELRGTVSAPPLDPRGELTSRQRTKKH